MRSFLLPILCFLILWLDYYYYKAILGTFKNWSRRTRKAFTFFWWFYNISLVVGVFAAIFLNLFLTLRAVILVAFFLTTVSKVVMLPFLLIDDIRRVIKKIRLSQCKPKDAPSDVISTEGQMSRSAFLTKTGIIAAAVPFSSLSWGIISGAYDYQIKRVKLVLPNLPRAFDGFRIAQISDIHSGSFYNKVAVKGGIDLLNAEKPDAVFFTGDLVNNLTNEVKDYQDIFSKVKAPLGVYSVLGNHDYGDYYFGRENSPAKAKNLKDMIRVHEIMGFDLLMNQNRRIKVDGEEIGILGIENWGMGRFPRYGKMEDAVKGTDDIAVKLLLSHDPSHWRNEVLLKYPQIDAMFSGHTHGMQFGVRLENMQWSPVQYIYNEWAGLYNQQDQQLYVNVGYGFLGYPGRVGILPEITIFELKQA